MFVSFVFVGYVAVDFGPEFQVSLRQKNIPRREIRIIPSNNHGNKLLNTEMTYNGQCKHNNF